MSEQRVPIEEETPVDDVRRVREQLSRESGGDIARHMEQTNAAFEELCRRLHLKVITAPTVDDLQECIEAFDSNVFEDRK